MATRGLVDHERSRTEVRHRDMNISATTEPSHRALGNAGLATRLPRHSLGQSSPPIWVGQPESWIAKPIMHSPWTGCADLTHQTRPSVAGCRVDYPQRTIDTLPIQALAQ